LHRFAPDRQEYCLECERHLDAVQVRRRYRHCKDCRDKIRNALLLTRPPPPPVPLFDRTPSSLAHLTEVERAAAVALRRLGQKQEEAAEHIGCSRQTVAHWEHTYAERGDVHDGARSGRPRLTSDLEDTALVVASVAEPFDTPHRLKRKLELDVSPRTLDRRLIGAGLPGRVVQHKKKFSDEERRKRLAFAEGYKDWTEQQWESVLFADETSVRGAGFSGQQWVRRPVGEALNPDYMADKKAHPVKLHMWGCFCARGPGYCYIFNENLDAKLLKQILDEHLIPSAHLHYREDPPEPWSFLQDNDPKHRSRLVQEWLHNHGVQCLDFPPYSPDLNPMEHVWADIARRVERQQPSTMETLQDVVAEEWTATPLDFLRTLAHSMPKRCKAVIEARGEHTRF
jgi:transposase